MNHSHRTRVQTLLRGTITHVLQPSIRQATLDYLYLNALVYFYTFWLCMTLEQVVTDVAREARVHVDVTLRGIHNC